MPADTAMILVSWISSRLQMLSRQTEFRWSNLIRTGLNDIFTEVDDPLLQ